MPNLFCDNYRTCHQVVVDQGTDKLTEARARARGWHIFHGETMGGRTHNGVLCGQCVGSTRPQRVQNPLPQDPLWF